MAKNKILSSGIIYSTDPDFKPEGETPSTVETLAPSQQKLSVRLETKHRAGKAVTLLLGFAGTNTDKEMLGKNLKNFCGTGGSVKNGQIMVQGDHRDKIQQWLLKNGYRNVHKL